MNKKNIGALIQNRRKYLKISQSELSEISEIGLRTLIDIESGNGNPTLEKLQKIFDALGLMMEVKVKG